MTIRYAEEYVVTALSYAKKTQSMAIATVGAVSNIRAFKALVQPDYGYEKYHFSLFDS
jgi:hypothetical protein